MIAVADVAAPEDERPENRPYRPQGRLRELWAAADREILVAGPAGTGKSRACLELLYYLLTRDAGARGLIVRKTRESITDSVLVTWEQHVVPEGHPILRGPRPEHRGRYRFPNGSELVIAGLRQSGRDMTQKVMSTEYDYVYVPEAIELTQEDWERLLSRVGRRQVVPHARLFADTNPSRPSHWLKKRCDAGKTRLIESRHEDNPVLYAEAAGKWTKTGEDYLATLDNLSGVMLKRLRYGKWSAAEGVVYEEFDPDLHVVEPFDVPDEWACDWSIDFGFVNPFVWQEWRIDGDGRAYLTDEIYRTGILVEEAAALIKARTAGRVPPRRVICDHDAEDRATLEKHLGIATRAAVKDLSPGIQAVKARLRKAGDGRPRLFLFAGACPVSERDPKLAGEYKPSCTAEEFEAYVWPEDAAGKPDRREQPVKEFDHGLDALRYFISEIDLPKKTQFRVF